MEHLYHVGNDRFGALGVSTSAAQYLPRPMGPLPRLAARIIAGGSSPFGGTKPKALINIDGARWVIKFFNNESVDAPWVEHAT